MIDIINGNLCSLIGVSLVLLGLGRVYADPKQRRIGGIIALIGFLTYGAYCLHVNPPRTADELFERVTLRALMVFFILLGLLWILTPLASGFLSGLRKGFEGAYEAKYETHHRAVSFDQAPIATPKAVERKEAEQVRKEIEQKHRDASRNKVEVFYLDHSILTSRLDRPTVDGLLAKMMHDGLPPDVVEANGKIIRDLMESQLRQIQPPDAKEKAKGERVDAQKEVRTYYEANADLLRDVYPREMFEVYLRKEMGDQIEPDKCWEGAKSLIGELQKLVAKQKRNQERTETAARDRETQIKDIESEIEVRGEKIEKLRESKNQDVVEHEILDEKARIKHLEAQLKILKDG